MGRCLTADADPARVSKESRIRKRGCPRSHGVVGVGDRKCVCVLAEVYATPGISQQLYLAVDIALRRRN